MNTQFPAIPKWTPLAIVNALKHYERILPGAFNKKPFDLANDTDRAILMYAIHYVAQRLPLQKRIDMMNTLTQHINVTPIDEYLSYKMIAISNNEWQIVISDIDPKYENEPTSFIVKFSDLSFAPKYYLSNTVGLAANDAIALYGNATFEDIKTMPYYIERAYAHNHHSYYEELLPNNEQLMPVPISMLNAPIEEIIEAHKNGTKEFWDSLMIARGQNPGCDKKELPTILYICDEHSFNNYKLFYGHKAIDELIEDDDICILSAPSNPYARPLKARLSAKSIINSCTTSQELVEYWIDNGRSSEVRDDILIERDYPSETNIDYFVITILLFFAISTNMDQPLTILSSQ